MIKYNKETHKINIHLNLTYLGLDMLNVGVSEISDFQSTLSNPISGSNLI